MSKPTLSVVLGNYNHGNYITEALDAILSQTVLPTEIIVIDDGSTDDSVEVIEEVARKHRIIRLFRNDKNRGVIFTYNRAAKIASGDYVYIATATDIVLPGFFEKSMELLSQYPRAGLCHTELKTLQGREYKFYLGRRQLFFSVDELTVIFKKRGYFTASGINSIMRRDALLQSGGLVPQAGPFCDLFAAMAIGIRHGLCYIPEPLVAIRIMEDSYSGAVKRQGAQMRKLFQNILTLLDTPAYRELGDWIARTGVWPTLFPSMLYVLLKDRARWRYLSPGLVQRALWIGVRNILGRILPPGAKKFSFKIRDAYRKLVVAAG